MPKGLRRARPHEHEHRYYFNQYCGIEVCEECGYHKGLARCFCGWSSGRDGYTELLEYGEIVDPDY